MVQRTTNTRVLTDILWSRTPEITTPSRFAVDGRFVRKSTYDAAVAARVYVLECKGRPAVAEKYTANFLRDHIPCNPWENGKKYSTK